jgi:hypothetical protein
MMAHRRAETCSVDKSNKLLWCPTVVITHLEVVTLIPPLTVSKHCDRCQPLSWNMISKTFNVNLVISSSKNLHGATSSSWKLTGSQLLRKFPAFYVNPKVPHRIHKSPSPVPILSRIDPVHAPPPTSTSKKINFNIILPPMPGSSKWFLPSGF